jgi:hypothetical protein
MTEPLQVGQFAIVDHEPVDRGPNAGVFPGKGPADDRAELYLLAEGTTPAGESFAGHVVSAAGQSWQALDMSLTGALRRVFADANANLLDWNRKSIAQHRVSLGLVAFARRGPQAVIAQAGPSIAFHRSGTTVTSYVADDEHAQPVGAEAEVEPQLTRIAFEPGDRLLMLSTGALAALDDDVLEGILALPQEQVLSNLYRRLQHLRHVTVLFVSEPGEAQPRLLEQPAEYVIGAPPAAAGEARAEEPSGFQPSLFIDDPSEDVLDAARRQISELRIKPREANAVLPAVITEMPAPLRRAVGDVVTSHMESARRPRASAALLTATGSAPHDSPMRQWRPAAARAAAIPEPPGGEPRRHSRGGSFTRSLAGEVLPPLPPSSSSSAPLVSELADELRARPVALSPVSETIATENAVTLATGGSLVRVRGNMPGRRGGGGSLSGRTALSLSPGKLPPTWLIVLGGLGLLLAIVAGITIPRIMAGNGGAAYADLVSDAQSMLATARAEPDPAAKRLALAEAQALVLEARDAQAAGPEAEALAKDIAADVAALDNVRTPAVDVISSLEQFGERPVAATRLVVSETTGYVLDNASGQVVALPLDGSAHKVIYGEDKDARRARPVAMVYLASLDLGEPSLLILDAAGALWAQSEGRGLRQVPFALPAGASATDITTFGRDLYVLDAPGNTVYRMTPGQGGFNGVIKALVSKEIGTARRLTVDREIVLSDATGAIHVYSGEVALTLSGAGIDKKLVAAEAAQSLGKSGDLAVLDAPNNRVVVFRRDGAFDHQYQSKDFQAVSAFTVGNGAGYVFSGGKLRRFALE